MCKFTFLNGDVDYKKYGGKWISNKLNNSEFDYWLVIAVTNLEDYRDEFDYKYNVEIHAVSPDQAGEINLDHALDGAGFSNDQLAEFFDGKMSDEMKVEVLDDYGIFAMLRYYTGNNFDKLMKEAKRECQLIQMLFGFYMDKRENMIGQTGWNLIAGQNVRSFLGVK